MTTQINLTGQHHWNYYLTVIEDLVKASRFVEFTPENFQTHSVEFVRIILAVGSEIDVVAKQLCEQSDSQKTASNINEYREMILSRYPAIPTIEIIAPKHGLGFTPWAKWQDGENPPWWGAYNNVKHRRNAFYREANLENALESSSALCALLGYLYVDFFAATPVISRPLLFFSERYFTKLSVLTANSLRLP